MAKMTKAQHAKHDRLYAMLQAERDKVYAFGESDNVPLSICYERADKAVKTNYDAAWKALFDFELEMVAQGRAWFSASGVFTPYYK